MLSDLKIRVDEPLTDVYREYKHKRDERPGAEQVYKSGTQIFMDCFYVQSEAFEASSEMFADQENNYRCCYCRGETKNNVVKQGFLGCGQIGEQASCC